jgi:hypothetical protein
MSIRYKSQKVENKALVGQIVAFIEGIGISIKTGSVPDSTFLPGIQIEQGQIRYDPEKLKYPGDLLHEAGHIAVSLPEERKEMHGNVNPDAKTTDGGEIGAIIWSYAVVKHLGIDPHVVFHQDGYKGDSEWLVETYEANHAPGLPLLKWMGLCKQDDDTDETVLPFPHMIKWLRE